MLGFTCSSITVGCGVMPNLTWYQTIGLRFNSSELHVRGGAGVSVKPHGKTASPLGI